MDFPFALCHDIEVFFTYSTFFRCRSVTCAISRFQNAPFKTKTIKICAPFESYCQCNGIEREWKKLHLVCMTTCAFMVVHVNKFMWQSLYIHSTLSNTLSLLGKKRVLSYHKMQFEYASNRAFNAPYGMILEMALFLHVINKNSGGKNTIPLNY